MKSINLNFSKFFIIVLIGLLILFPFWNESDNNIYPALEINDGTIGYYQSTTCNISLINVLRENLANDLNLKYNNNNYPGVECFGKVTGLDKVNDVYIVSIGTNSNITFLLQFAIWGLMFLLAPSFKFNYKKIQLSYVSLLSLFFTFQQFGEERFYSQVNKYFDLSISANNYYLISIFFSFYITFVFISILFENNKGIFLNFFPFMFLIVGSFNGFNLNYFSLIFSYIGLKALFERKTNLKFNMTYLVFAIAWVQTRKDSNSYFDTDKLNGFINSSNNLPSIIYWILLFFLLINGVIYIYKEVSFDMRLINLNLLISSNLILIFGMLGGAYPVQNFFNYIIFGQNKRGINSLASVDGNTWRGFSSSAESIGEFYAFVLLFYFLSLLFNKIEVTRYSIFLLILPIFGLYKSNNFAAIISFVAAVIFLIIYKRVNKYTFNKVLLFTFIGVILGSLFLINILGYEYASTQLLYEASLHSNFFTYLSSEAKSIEITRYFDAGQIEALINVENRGRGSQTLIYLSQIYNQSFFDIPYVPNLVAFVSFVSIVINRNEMWGIFSAKYNPNVIETFFGNGPYQLNNYLYNLKITLDVPQAKINSLYLPHSSLLDSFIFFGIAGVLLIFVWNFYTFKLNSQDPAFKFLLFFILINFLKSDSLLYLNSLILLVFVYALIHKSKEITIE